MNNKFTVNDLNLYYGDFHALKNINLDIKEKEITAFIGPSGCGKSTFLKTLNRMNDLVESTKISGDICLDGTDIYKNMDAIELRRRVGMVFQQPNPFPKVFMAILRMAQEFLESKRKVNWMKLLKEV